MDKMGNSVPERAFSGTEYACCAKKGFLVYATRFLKPSVLKNRLLGYRRDIRYQKPHSLVRNKPCTGKDLLVYRMKRRNAAQAPRSVILRKTAICMLLLLPLNSRRQLWTTSNDLRLPPTPLNYRWLPRPTARLPPSRPDRYQAPSNYVDPHQRTSVVNQ